MFDAQSVEAMGVGLAGLGVWHAGASVYRLGSVRGRRLGASLAGHMLSEEPTQGWLRTVPMEDRKVLSEEGGRFLRWGLVPAVGVTLVWLVTNPGVIVRPAVPGVDSPFQMLGGAALVGLVNVLAWYALVACLAGFLLGAGGVVVGGWLRSEEVRKQGQQAAYYALVGAVLVAFSSALLNLMAAG